MGDPHRTGRRAYRMQARAQELADTRERTLAAAREAFLQRPFGDVTLQDIAASAEVTRQTVLNHFESKDGVFPAAAESVVSQRHLAGSGDEADAPDALVAEYEEFGDALVRLLEVEERFPAVRTWLERGRRGHRDWVEATFGQQLATHGGHAIHGGHAPAEGVARRVAGRVPADGSGPGRQRRPLTRLGAGVRLRAGARSTAIASAVGRILDEPDFATAARRVAARLVQESTDPPRFVQELETLARDGQVTGVAAG